MSHAAFRQHMITFAKATITVLRSQPQGLSSSEHRDLRNALDNMVKADHIATLDEQDAEAQALVEDIEGEDIEGDDAQSDAQTGASQVRRRRAAVTSETPLLPV